MTVDCSNPATWLLVLLLIANWIFVTVVYIGLSGKQSSLAKTLIYFVQVSWLILGSGNTLHVWLQLANMQLNGGGFCLFKRSYFESIAQQFLFPVISTAQLVIVIVIIQFVHYIRGRHFDASRYWIRPLIAILLGSYTPLTTAALQVLNCRPVGQYTVLVNAPAISCNSSAYILYRNIAIAVVVTVTAGVPLLLLILLIRWRHNIAAKQRGWGYIFEAYRVPMFWWQVVELARRSGLSALTLIIDTGARSFALFLSCIVIYVLQHIIRPIADKHGNSMELISLGVLAVIAGTNASSLFSTSYAQFSLDIVMNVAIVLTVICIAALIARQRRAKVIDLWHGLRSRCKGHKSKDAPLLTEHLI